MALAIRAAEPLDAEAIRAYIAARLAAYKVPAQVYLHTTPLPRNATGKVLKAELQKTIAQFDS
ncbi:acyl-CoA synthetase [compost metagenome]